MQAAPADEQFRLLADSIPQLAWMADAAGAIFWYSRRWYEYTGSTPEQMEGWGWQSVHHPEVLPGVLERWRDSLARGEPFEMEFPLRRKDGQYRWFLTQVSPVRDASGQVVRWFGTNTDIHAWREMREEAARGEERLRFALAAARMGTYAWTAGSDRLEWSAELCRLHGLEPREFRGTYEHARELTHPDDYQRVNEVIARSTREGGDFEVEYRVILPRDGSVRWLYAYGHTSLGPSGAARLLGAVMDITDRKRVDEALRASVEIGQTLNQVGQAIAGQLDLDQLVQTVTDAATRLTRAQFGAFFYNVINEKGESYTLYTISGVPREAFARFPMPRNTAVFQPTFDGTGIVRSDDITRDPRYGKSAPHHGMPAGHLPVVSYLAVPVISRSGEVLGGLFFGHAQPGVFTEREEELVKGLAGQTAVAIDNARLYQRSQEAVKLRDEFLSIASHELKTPLTPLRLQMQTLEKHAAEGTLASLPPERLQRVAEVSLRQVSRLTRLIEDLLDVARINAGKLKLNHGAGELVALVKEAVDRYAPGAPVTVHAPPLLHCKCDALRIEQVFVNLLTNALKYAPGQPVEVFLREEGGEAILEVKDLGPGIAHEDQDRIFGRYERLGSSQSVGGLGLGLFIARQIVEAHGGSLSVKSEPGHGSVFTVRLPV